MVFDLDGTLVDSARDLGESASGLVQGYGAPPLAVAQVVTMVGDGAPVLVRRALERAGPAWYALRSGPVGAESENAPSVNS